MVRGYNISIMTLGQFSSINSIIDSVTRADAFGNVHIAVKFWGIVNGSLWETGVRYYEVHDHEVISSSELAAVLDLDLAYSYDNDFDMAVDPSGNVHFGLVDVNHTLYHVTNVGGNWSKVAVGNLGSQGTGVSVAVDSGGAVHMSYVNSTGFGEPTLRYVNNTYGNWTSTMFRTDYSSEPTSIALDSDGHVFIGCGVTYLESVVSYVTNVNGQFQRFDTSLKITLLGPRWLALDAEGNVRIVFQSTMHRAPIMSNAWVAETIPGSVSQVEEDAQGHLHIFYVSYDSYSYTSLLKYASDKFEKPTSPIASATVPVPGGVTVAWAPPVDSGSLPVTEYDLFYGVYPNATTYRVVVGPSVTSYTFANLSTDTYCFNIAPVTLAGFGANLSVNATPLLPSDHAVSAAPPDHTLAVVGAATIIVVAIAFAVVMALRRKEKARVFTVAFACLAIAVSSILPAYVADAAWDSQQDVWTETMVYSGEIGSTSMVIDVHGHAHIAAASNGLIYATNSSGAWITTEVDPTLFCMVVSLAVDSMGFAHIALVNASSYSFYHGPLIYATNTDGSWNVSEIDNLDVNSCRIALGPDGQVHIGYTTEDYTYLHRVILASLTGDTWRSETVERNRQANENIWMGGMAVNKTGAVILAYGESGHVHVAIRDQGGLTISDLGEGYSPTMALDSNDVVYVCFTASDNLAGPGRYSIQGNSGWRSGDIGLPFVNILAFDLDVHNQPKVAEGNQWFSPDLFLGEGGFGNMTATPIPVSTSSWPSSGGMSMALLPSGAPSICSESTAPDGNNALFVFERDMSEFTLSERLDKGWTAAETVVLRYWLVAEALMVLGFLLTWRMRVWKSRRWVETPRDYS